MYWPCFSMHSWVKVLSSSFPEFIFGGFKMEQQSKWRALFKWFWSMYHAYDSDHEIYKTENLDHGVCIPYMTHGDEGRGLRSQAFMVESFQFVISNMGPYTTNTSGHLGFIWQLFIYDLSTWGDSKNDKNIQKPNGYPCPRHSFTTRWLFTCISSKLYDGEKTLRDLHTEWARQMRSLFLDGFKA